MVGNRPAVDRIWEKMKAENPRAEILDVHIPADAQGSIEVSINPDAGTFWKTDYRYFDQYTLEELPVEHMWGRFQEASLADKAMRMNYDVHVGAIAGLPGKIIAFLDSLIAASLPLTGFYIWWGRRKKTATVAKITASRKTAPAAASRLARPHPHGAPSAK
jgi:uncharacterized iron-regulated membrane protein